MRRGRLSHMDIATESVKLPQSGPDFFDKIIRILLSIVNEPEGKSFQGFRPGGRFERRFDGPVGRIQNSIGHDVFLSSRRSIRYCRLRQSSYDGRIGGVGPSGVKDSNGTPVTAQVPPEQVTPMGSVTAFDM